jgi:ribonuclease P protein component
VLPAAQRLRDSTTFREVVRRGRRSGGPVLVVHRHDSPGVPTARAGLIVSRAVGPAVTRNVVKRRLRHLLRPRLAELPAGTVLVVRALPGAASASFVELGEELDRALRRLARQVTR